MNALVVISPLINRSFPVGTESHTGPFFLNTKNVEVYVLTGSACDYFDIPENNNCSFYLGSS